uniref:Uncharacterized protein n=1 Tax=Peronospora matthiolae TaxID=2874970 RepID=A0AAV1VPC6_9STRA
MNWAVPSMPTLPTGTRTDSYWQKGMCPITSKVVIQYGVDDTEVTKGELDPSPDYTIWKSYFDIKAYGIEVVTPVAKMY